MLVCTVVRVPPVSAVLRSMRPSLADLVLPQSGSGSGLLRISIIGSGYVGLVSGACLGGGLELALACDYRVAVKHPKTQFGFPEVELGLLPAWGGTQRLPRVVGLERALQMILGARRAKNFAESDRIRDELLAMGIQLKDGKDPATGEPVTTWEVKR